MNFFHLILWRELSFRILFYMIILVFFVKMPVFMFHVWLPLAHVESPMIGSIVLARLILKLGSYGIFQIKGIFK